MATVSGNAICQPPASEPVQAKRTRVIGSDPDVARVVGLLNAHDDTLVSLSKAFEIVKGDLGQGNQKLGGQKAAVLSGVEERDLLDFVANVAHPILRVLSDWGP